jgi:hypothetical protein
VFKDFARFSSSPRQPWAVAISQHIFSSENTSYPQAFPYKKTGRRNRSNASIICLSH